MQFSVTRDNLFEALQNVIGVIPAKSTLPILQNVKIYTEDGLLKLMATDMEITLLSWAHAVIEEEGATALPAKTLFDIIRELPDTEIRFSIDDLERATITTDFGQYKLVGQSASEFPKVPEVDARSDLSIENNLLSRMIEKTIFTCAKDDLRPALNGVLFEIQQDLIRAVSTDGHRLTKLEINNHGIQASNLRALIPVRVLNFVQRLLNDEGESTVYFGDKHALFNVGETLVYTRLIYQEQFPNYSRVLPTSFDYEMKINKNDFISSLKRIKIFASHITHQVFLNIHRDYLEISAEDVDFGGEGKERISCEFNGDSLFMAFNAQYLLEILQHMDSDDVIMKMTSINIPAILEPAEQMESENYLVLIMPVKVIVREE